MAKLKCYIIHRSGADAPYVVAAVHALSEEEARNKFRGRVTATCCGTTLTEEES
jgi:hypothetical protein